MATPRRPQPRKPPASNITYNRADPNHVLVDPRWLGKIFAGTVIAAFVCAYLLMCVLFRLGSWQWVLHPTHNPNNAGSGLQSELVHFGPDATGAPQLTGEWIPAAATSAATVLYLRPGDGQLDFADAPLLRMLHEDGLNVLAFDYRGYGRSAAKPHPTQQHMQQDAEAAWTYLTDLRSVPANKVLLYGTGVGASVAANLAAAHLTVAGLVLRNATADVLGTIRDQKRARMFPVSLLLADRFDLHTLDQLGTPKLLLDIGSDARAPETTARIAAYQSAATPKVTVTLPHEDPAQEQEALRRFVDAQPNLHAPPGILLPAPAQTK